MKKRGNKVLDQCLYCRGEFCAFAKFFDCRGGETHSFSELKTESELEVEGRVRAHRATQKVLTDTELSALEESGKHIHLCVPKCLSPHKLKYVPNETVLLSKNEHRLALIHLSDAEDCTAQPTSKEEQCMEYLLDKQEATYVNNTIKREELVLVCEVCYNVYRLLSLARYLLNEQYIKSSPGNIEYEVFELQKCILTTDAAMNRKKRKIDKTIKMADKGDPILRQPNLSHSKGRGNHENNILKQRYRNEEKEREKNVHTKRSSRGKEMKTPLSYPPIANLCASNETHIIDGKFELDSQTSFPYSIIGTNNSQYQEPSKSVKSGKGRILSSSYNMIVCQDIFDTLERFKIMFSPLLTGKEGRQVLLWNYPGQAFTAFPKKESMNNEFHAKCLEKLIYHVGAMGTKEFDTSKEFHVLGFGYGGAVACLHTSNYRSPNLKSLFLVNPLSFVDTHFASVIHDCRNVFLCSPETRPDLPFYFYSRFLFSDDYLKKTSTSLALNLYTAVHNPISITGRVKLCDGALDSIDLRERIKGISVPIITIHGKKSGLIRPLHGKSFMEGRESFSSFQQALKRRGKRSAIIMIDGGHELFQERKSMILRLVEQLMGEICQHVKKTSSNYEARSSPVQSCSLQKHELYEQWANASESTTTSKSETKFPSYENGGKSYTKMRGRGYLSKNALIVLNPSNPTFERQKNSIYKPGSGGIYPDPRDTQSKIQEYMSWRLKRNLKTLSRFQKAAKVIQSALRVFMAKTMVKRLQRQTSVLNIQRCYRGMLGRQIFLQRRTELWAARFVQRAYRGRAGRQTAYHKRMTIQAQIILARVWRGHKARMKVNLIISNRNIAAIKFQGIWRRYQAVCIAEFLTLRLQSCIIIQRILRGHKGRRRAATEREKYWFSKSQSSGIEMGRQMLAEHKLHASKLQSEMKILEDEKTSLELKVKDLMSEISSFEDRVEMLEKSMKELSLFDTENSSKQNLYAVREKRMRFDEEFSVVLTKIADRKHQLKSLELKLATLVMEKRSKTEKIKLLERKLVALLEAQENALVEIRRRQEMKDLSVLQRQRGGKERELTRDSTIVGFNDKRKMAKLMNSTEAMMKFGFMNMGMTYFTSLNMVKAMQTMSHHDVESLAINDDEESMRQKDKGSQKNRTNDGYRAISALNWNVDDVSKWLATIALSQYIQAFRDGSVDGPFLFQLTDEDLRNILGVEHQLHRKKILFSVTQLQSKINRPEPKESKEASEKTEISELAATFGGEGTRKKLDSEVVVPRNDLKFQRTEERPPIPAMDELSRWIRNQKVGAIQDALESLPSERFDDNCVRVQFVENAGTTYKLEAERQLFHLNTTDEHGNTLMHIAAQNGNVRIAKLLIERGANPDHQNKQGQTPGHFAVSYQFFDFASWLYDPNGAGGNDLLTNMYGLGPYDGLVL